MKDILNLNILRKDKKTKDGLFLMVLSKYVIHSS
jgi:hypothetical protein